MKAPASKTKKKSILLPLIIYLAVTSVCIMLAVLHHNGSLDRLLGRGASDLKEVIFDDLIAYEPDHLSQNLLLVNSDHMLTSDFEPDLTEYRTSGVQMNSCMTDDYGNLSDHIRDKMGDKLYVMSSYRSFEDQKRVYDEEGPEIAALPGSSEHQTGLALDVYVMYFAGENFINNQVGRYVNDHCQEYGFIIRYPEGKEDITGFKYEPWHIRYVGLPHSTIIASNGLTLEEYIGSYETGKWYETRGYVIARLPADRIQIPEKYSDTSKYEITVSPDNCGNVFVTIRTEADER